MEQLLNHLKIYINIYIYIYISLNLNKREEKNIRFLVKSNLYKFSLLAHIKQHYNNFQDTYIRRENTRSRYLQRGGYL